MRILHHHVGGRDGSTPFRFPVAFDTEIDRVLYDADSPDSCFVGVDGQRVRFQINYCPYTSSGKDINPAFAPYYIPLSGMDYVVGDVSQPQQVVELTARSLDALQAKPDLLSLDTQGGEGDILQGAEAALEHTLAVVAEVQFNQVYLDAPLFGDIAAILQSRGFLFVEFQDIGRFAPMRGRMHARGKGLMLFADAVFFKDPARVADPLARRKLAFVALCRAQLEFAQLCLTEVYALPASAPAWLRFVEEFRKLCEAPGFVPWSFTEGWTAERSAARFGKPSAADAQRMADEAATRAMQERARTVSMIGRDGEAMISLFEKHGLSDVASIVAETFAANTAAYRSSLGR